LILLADADGAAVGVEFTHDARRVLRAESERLMMYTAPDAVAEFLKWQSGTDRNGSRLTNLLGAGVAPGVTPFALADPIARRIRPPGREACWIAF
jgi:hypothetical protein